MMPFSMPSLFSNLFVLTMPFSNLFVLAVASSSTVLPTGEGELKMGGERRTKVVLDVATGVVTVGGWEWPNIREEEGLLDGV